jgi:hypothetical protein
MAYRFVPRIAVPSRTRLRMRWAARMSASVSLVLLAPLSGSKRFFAMITSVPTMLGAPLTTCCADPIGATDLLATGSGKPQGPSCQSQYIFSPTPARDTAKTQANTTMRGRMIKLLETNSRKAESLKYPSALQRSNLPWSHAMSTQTPRRSEWTKFANAGIYASFVPQTHGTRHEATKNETA